MRGTVAGKPVLMLVDTGANGHVIAGWFARKLALKLEKAGDVGVDHVGKTIEAYRVQKPQIAIDGWGAVAETSVLAAEVPDGIEALGIGAFISPQRLAEEGHAVVLDLRGGTLRAERWEDAATDLLHRGAPLLTATSVRTCEEEGPDPSKGVAFVVPATVGGERVDLLLDSGAERTDLLTGSNAAKRLGKNAQKSEPVYTASGKSAASRLAGTKLVAGKVSATLDINLIGGASDPACPRDGVLAMDVLRRCTVLLSSSRVAAHCAQE